MRIMNRNTASGIRYSIELDGTQLSATDSVVVEYLALQNHYGTKYGTMRTAILFQEGNFLELFDAVHATTGHRANPGFRDLCKRLGLAIAKKSFQLNQGTRDVYQAGFPLFKANSVADDLCELGYTVVIYVQSTASSSSSSSNAKRQFRVLKEIRSPGTSYGLLMEDTTTTSASISDEIGGGSSSDYYVATSTWPVCPVQGMAGGGRGGRGSPEAVENAVVAAAATTTTTMVERTLSNHILGVWVFFYEHMETHRPHIVVGVAVFNMFTGRCQMMQYDQAFLMIPAVFDELERVFSVFRPREIVLIQENDVAPEFSRQRTHASYTFDLARMLQFCGVHYDPTTGESNTHQLIHVVDATRTTLPEDMRTAVKHCTRQVYQQEILAKCYADNPDCYTLVQEFAEYPVATQAFCYLLDFVAQHNPDLVQRMELPTLISDVQRKHVVLANHTLKQLNIIDTEGVSVADGQGVGYRSVLQLVNKCCTPMGRRRVTALVTAPIFDEVALEAIYAKTEYVLHPDRLHFVTLFRDVLGRRNGGDMDLEKFGRQLVVGRVAPVSLFRLYHCLGALQTIHTCLYEDQGLFDFLLQDCPCPEQQQQWEPLADTTLYGAVQKKLTGMQTTLASTFCLDECVRFGCAVESSGGGSIASLSFLRPGVDPRIDELVAKYRRMLAQLTNLHLFLNDLVLCTKLVTEDREKSAAGGVGCGGGGGVQQSSNTNTNASSGSAADTMVRVRVTEKQGWKMEMTKIRGKFLKRVLSEPSLLRVVMDMRAMQKYEWKPMAAAAATHIETSASVSASASSTTLRIWGKIRILPAAWKSSGSDHDRDDKDGTTTTTTNAFMDIDLRDVLVSASTGSSSTYEEIRFHQWTDINQALKLQEETIGRENATFFRTFVQRTLATDWYNDLVHVLTHYLTAIDILQCRAHVAHSYHYCRPVLGTESGDGGASGAASRSWFHAEGLRHALIEHIQRDEYYVANDVAVEGVVQGMCIYGTNAVGKTSLIRAVGIAVVLAQSGFFVPATRFVYRPYTAIFSRILGNDDLFRGMSTFVVEMSELRVILNNADRRSLVLGDELCSGTESSSALSIFVAGLRHLVETAQCSFLLATHFHEILQFPEIKDMCSSGRLQMKHMSVLYDASLDGLVYCRLLEDGPGANTYGLEVCKSLYMPTSFLQCAFEVRQRHFPCALTRRDRGGGGQSWIQGVSSSVLRQSAASSYNAKKLKGGLCEICGHEESTEIHHLEMQQLADSRGYFANARHKNHLGNLVAICESCHHQLHLPHSATTAVVQGHIETPRSRSYSEGGDGGDGGDGGESGCGGGAGGGGSLSSLTSDEMVVSELKGAADTAAVATPSPQSLSSSTKRLVRKKTTSARKPYRLLDM